MKAKAEYHLTNDQVVGAYRDNVLLTIYILKLDDKKKEEHWVRHLNALLGAWAISSGQFCILLHTDYNCEKVQKEADDICRRSMEDPAE